MIDSTPLRVAMALVWATSLAACSQRSKAEEAVRESLKDPDSAKFGDFYFNEKTGRACLTVNAKNSMGGYTGDRYALLVTDDNVWALASMDAVNLEHCRRTADSAV